MKTKTLKTLLFIASITAFSENTLAANVEPFDQLTAKTKSTDNAQMKYSFVLKKANTQTVLMEVPAIYSSTTIDGSFPPLPVTMKNTSVNVFLKRVKAGGKPAESKIGTYKYSIPTFKNPGSYTKGLSEMGKRLGFSQNVQFPADLSKDGLIFSDLYAKKYIEKLLGHSVSEPAFDDNKPTTSDNNFIETFVSGSKTFSYTKIANDGSELPKTAKLGTGAKDWACTKDNNTSLIWEVKSTDGGLRDKDKTYSRNDFFSFVSSVREQTLCGAKDWRMPTVQELSGLLVCSDGKYTNRSGVNGIKNLIDCASSDDVTSPTINTKYFPDINDNYWFWSYSFNTSDGSFSDFIWGVHFRFGGTLVDSWFNNHHLRLVHG